MIVERARQKNHLAKKQWRLTKIRRCKNCIISSQEMIPSAGIDATLVPLYNDIFTDALTKSRTRDIKPNQQLNFLGDGDLFKVPPPLEDCPICF